MLKIDQMPDMPQGMPIVDRIAANIAMAAGDYPWDEQSAETKASARINAIAVLEDIYDLPDAMLEAGSAACSAVPIRNTLHAAWRAMIKWAIEEHERTMATSEVIKDPQDDRSIENAVRNILAGMDRKGAVGVSLDRAAIEALLDPAGNVFEVEFIGGDKS